ncbi:hypothetical protein ACFL0O_05695 [Thermodesulfobacteriota bacterium]
MTPLYFPFTFIPDHVLQALFACFRHVAVYQPSRKNIPESMLRSVENGMLDLCVPTEADEDKLVELLKAYKDWANLHQGSEIAFYKTFEEAVPFFDETSTSQIRSTIRKKIREEPAGEKPDSTKQDPLFQARLFLQVAQEMDMQKSGVIDDLLKLEEMEQKLFQELKGDTAFSHRVRSDEKRYRADDPGSFMTQERLAAWSYLMQYDFQHTGPENSGLFLTASRSIIEHILDRDTGMEAAYDFDEIPVSETRVEAMEEWRGRLAKYLEMMVEKPWPLSEDTGLEPCPEGICDKKISLTIYVVPDETPGEFFGRFLKQTEPRTRQQDGGRRLRNTLIGLVRKKS